MDVMNQLIDQSSLRGMPKWFKALAILSLIAVLSLILITLIMLLKNSTDLTITYGYLYDN